MCFLLIEGRDVCGARDGSDLATDSSITVSESTPRAQVFCPSIWSRLVRYAATVSRMGWRSRMSSLAEVARRAGVSKATASRALSGAAHVSPAARERVAAAASDLGYVVSSTAASLVTGR